MNASPQTSSPWVDDSNPPRPSIPLRHDATADVCIVGAGVSGLSVAYELSKRGASVVVIDQGDIGRGQTANTTAHLVTALDERYFEIERLHGASGAALARQSHAAAIDRIESIVRAEAIDCRFTRLDGYIFVPPSRNDAAELLERELSAATRAGARAEHLPTTPELGIDASCLHFPQQAQIHPLHYLNGLVRSIRSHRGRIFTGARVSSVIDGKNTIVTTDDHFRISAGAVVIATNSPIRERSDTLPGETFFRSFVIAIKMPMGALTPALYWDGYWDDDTPYHYVRVVESARTQNGEPHCLLIVGGEDEEITDPLAPLTPHDLESRFAKLRDWAHTHFPMAGEVTHRWHGRILEPDDELAFIGRLAESEANTYVISGDSGNGMTYAAMAGIMLPELIAGRTHPWSEIYSPTRRRLSTPCRRMMARRGASRV